VTARPLADPLAWNVAALLAELPGASRDYLVAGVTIDLGDDLRLADPIEGRVHLARTNRGLYVDADLETSLATTCSRCLREIEVPLRLRIREEALPALDLKTGQPLNVAAEPDSLRLTEHHELDIEQAVREAIQLAEPIAPLCEPDCPGLCVVCGERLSGGPHDHGEDDIDPRLEALRAFRVDPDGEGDNS
jgi:uncharacterized protein